MCFFRNQNYWNSALMDTRNESDFTVRMLYEDAYSLLQRTVIKFWLYEVYVFILFLLLLLLSVIQLYGSGMSTIHWILWLCCLALEGAYKQ